ncbi:hypothetical protein ACFVIM_19160 [Streptomyces sp. NPDC057638]|uniref:hypothetical protein n=1 Tax=Streptomyces sp. NPDC057638 TaxID=3346190 RepID=UPI003679DB53
MTSPTLLVADQIAGTVAALSLPDGTETARIEGRHLAEHAGFLALPGSRTAFVDDRAGELVVLDPHGPAEGRPFVTATAPVATPAEHLATDPSGQLVAVSTGLGWNATPWSDLLTVVDLTGDRRGPRSVRVRTRTGEPGVTVTAPTDDTGGLVVLRHREPGSLTAYRVGDLLNARFACPAAEPVHELPLPDDGHGDAYDHESGWLYSATGAGVHRTRAEGDRLTVGEPLPWDGPGRGYYLRRDPVRGLLWSCVRGGPADPGRWPEWTNDAWWHRIGSDTVGRVPLGPGLVFRLAVAARHVAYARIHPDGDELVLLDAGSDGPRVVHRLPLPAMDGAPRAGGTPWDGVQRRAVAASPGGGLIAVTRGGHGEIHLVDATAGNGTPSLTTITVPTPLDEGGHLALVHPGDGAESDPIGR